MYYFYIIINIIIEKALLINLLFKALVILPTLWVSVVRWLCM